MKHLISILLLSMVFSGFAVQFDYIMGNLQSVETGLTSANRYDYEVIKDSTIATLTRHFDKAGEVHLVADETTVVPVSTNYSGKSTSGLITFGNAVRLVLISHFAQDSCHVNAADVTTVIPAALSTSASYESARDYINALNAALVTHQATAHSTRYNYLGKIFAAAMIVHFANDTSDVSDVHYWPDEINNATAAFDTTNVDSTIAGWNRLAHNRWNPHIARYIANGDSVHYGYNALDSIFTVANDQTSLVTLSNEAITVLNQHVVRDTTATDSVHVKADINLITTAAVSTTSGHIAADATTFTGRGHTYYYVKKPDRLTVTFSGSGVSTGASFYSYGSIDGDDWYYIDSTSVTTNTAVPAHYNTNLHPYMKFFLNKRTDGTYKIQFRGEK